ncbi:hypothetical protein [Absidia glauca]|uniref:CBM21 domain-containing protein n=1 Tax=Absidia glauca TaxID=4829 RepID=A0A168N0R9_ABSGL|nr:hypothetical protein [Absidia glauca]
MSTLSYQQQSQSYLSMINNHHQQQHVSLQRRRVSINNRYGNQRRPLPSPPLPLNGTCSQKKKSVRFCSDNDLEQVRLFIKTQTPLAVQSDPPMLAEEDIRFDVKFPGWPSKWSMYKSLSQSVVRMENVQLVEDHHHDHLNNKVLLGRCRVSNLAFEKQVIVRYSFDYWQSHREINASYREPIASTTNTWDRFTFDIGLPPSCSSPSSPSLNNHRPLTCWIALRYLVNGQEFWDNNDGKNYQVNVMPVSTSPSTPPLQLSDNDDDDDDDDDPFLYHVPSSSSTNITSETKAKTTTTTTSSSPFHALDQLKFRYNFSTAQTTAVPHNPITSSAASAPSLHVGYQDFITKYCFYNSSPPASVIQN